MTRSHPIRATAFEGPRRIASGELPLVARKAKEVIDRGERAPVLIFDDTTSQVIDLDYRGTAEDVLSRLDQAASPGTPAAEASCNQGSAVEARKGPGADAPGSAARRPGRPKLGVVGREVTLLPRHWDWLNRQPGGASVALRKLVDEARRVRQSQDRIRQAQEAAYRFMSAVAGNEPGFEEGARALFARQKERFDEMVDAWPIDLRDHAKRLADPAFATEDGAPG